MGRSWPRQLLRRAMRGYWSDENASNAWPAPPGEGGSGWCSRSIRAGLLVLTNTITLTVFALVDLALRRVQRRDRLSGRQIMVPRLVPLLAAAMSMVLIGLEFPI